MSNTRADRSALLGLALLALWLFYPAILGGRAFYERDVHLVWHAQVEAFVRAVAAGSWPVWDPSVSFGHPLLANPNVQVFYPLTWLNLVLRPWTVYTVAIVSHSLASAAGVYLLARRLGASAAGGFVGAALWMVGGPFLSLTNVWHHFMGAAWIPWVWWLADRALVSGKRADAIPWGAAMALQLLAGSPDMSALTGLVMAAYVALHLGWRRPWLAANRAALSSAAVAAVVALGLSAAQWLPTLEVARRSARWSFPSEISTFWSVHPASAPEIVLPGLWGGLPLRPELKEALFSSREPFIASLYLGAPAVALVAAAFLLRDRRRIFLLAVALGALLFAMGSRTPFYDVVLFVWPPLRLLRYPVKAMVPAALAWSLLAALGFDAWRSAAVSRRRWLATVVAPVVAVAAVCVAGFLLAGTFAGRIGPALFGALPPAPYAELLRSSAARFALGAALMAAAGALALTRLRKGAVPWLAAAVAVLAVGDVAAFHRNLHRLAPRALYTVRPPILDVIGGPPARVYVYDYTALERSQRYLGRPSAFRLSRAPEGWRPEEAQALAMQMYLTPQTSGRWGLHGSYDIDYLGLYPQPRALLGAYLRRLESTPGHTRLLRLGAVDFVVALHEEGLGDLAPAAVLPGLFAEPIRVFRVPDPLPRAYLVPAARVVSDDEALPLLADPSFDPREEVVLPEGAPAAAPPGFRGTSRIETRLPDRLRVDVELTHPAHLVVVESHDAGWRATVDGVDAPLLRANLAFQAVAVPAGRHQVEMRYRPRSVVIGLIGSALTLAAALVAASRRAIMTPPHERTSAGEPGNAARG